MITISLIYIPLDILIAIAQNTVGLDDGFGSRIDRFIISITIISEVICVNIII